MGALWKQWVREAGLVLHAHFALPHDPGPQLKLAQLHEQLVLMPAVASLPSDGADVYQPGDRAAGRRRRSGTAAQLSEPITFSTLVRIEI